MLERKECLIPSCKRLGELREVLNGKPRYRALCPQHRRPGRSGAFLKNVPNGTCANCHKQTRCHRHRLGDPSRVYTSNNIIVLCPDCHAEAHGHTWKRIAV